METLTTTEQEQQQEQPVIKTSRRGRKPKYSTEEERIKAQRENSLKYYYRRKAKMAALKDEETVDKLKTASFIEIKVSTMSPTIGKIDETIKYKVMSNGELLKVQE